MDMDSGYRRQVANPSGDDEGHTDDSGTFRPAPSGAYGRVLLQWEAPEHEPLELGPRSGKIVLGALIAVVAFALYTDSALMAITFILIGVVGYLMLHRVPQRLVFALTTRGLVAGKVFYDYQNIASFHLYGEYPYEDILSLETEGLLVPYVHIPTAGVADEDVRELLGRYVPEETHEPGLVDSLERLLHI